MEQTTQQCQEEPVSSAEAVAQDKEEQEQREDDAVHGDPHPFFVDYHLIKDAFTEGLVWEETDVIELLVYHTKKRDHENKLMLVHAGPHRHPCQLSIDGEKFDFNQTNEDGKPDIQLFLVLIRTLYDPSVRLKAIHTAEDGTEHIFGNDFLFKTPSHHEDKPHIEDFTQIKFEDGEGKTLKFDSFTSISWGKQEVVRRLLKKENISSKNLKLWEALLYLEACPQKKTVSIDISLPQAQASHGSTRVMNHLLSVYPGGEEMPLPIFNRDYQSFHHYRNQKGKFIIQADQLKTRHGIFVGRGPMQRLPVENFFGSRHQYLVEFAYAVDNTMKEEEAAFKKFVEPRHTCNVTRVGKNLYLGVKRNTDRASTTSRIPEFRADPGTNLRGAVGFPDEHGDLPDFDQHNPNDQDVAADSDVANQIDIQGVIVENNIGVPNVDVLVKIDRSSSKEWQTKAGDCIFSFHKGSFSLRPSAVKAWSEQFGKDSNPGWYSVKLGGKFSTEMLRRRINVVEMLKENPESSWWPLLLNQTWPPLPKSNLFKSIAEWKQLPFDKFLDAFTPIWSKEIFSKVQWNEEQLAILGGLRNLTNKTLLCWGPFGTGKTTTQVGLIHALSHKSVGTHVLVLAPTNAAIDNIFHRFLAFFPDRDDVVRAVPSSRDYKILPRTAADEPAQPLDTGDPAEPPHEKKEVDPILLLQAELIEGADMKRKRRQLRSFTLTPTDHIVRRVQAKSHQLFKSYRQHKARYAAEGNYGLHLVASAEHEMIDTESVFEMYAECQRFIYMAKEKPHNEWDSLDKQHFKQCVKHLYKDVISGAKVIFSTTGHVSSDELNDFASGDDFVSIILDEASADFELDTLQAVIRSKFSGKVELLCMYGDPSQLKPHGSSNTGLNEFCFRTQTSLFTRLVNSNFEPSIPLVTQNRMSAVLAEYPNKAFYDSRLKTGNVAPGLPAESERSAIQRILNISDIDPTKVQLCWICVDGKKRTSDKRKTYCNLEVGERIVYYVQELIKVFGNKTNENVAILSFYARSRNHLSDRMAGIRRSNPQFTDKHIPDVFTVDSYQGSEARFVILNVDADSNRTLGFINESDRMCVATTRAKTYFWVVGPRLAHSDRSLNLKKTSTPIQSMSGLFESLLARGRVVEPKVIKPAYIPDDLLETGEWNKPGAACRDIMGKTEEEMAGSTIGADTAEAD